MDALYATLKERKRPEDVAQMVLETLGDRLEPWEARLLDRAARGSLKRRILGYTSMLQEFAAPASMGRQVSKAEDLFATAYPLTPEQCSDPEAVEAFLHHIEREVWKGFGRNDFRHDRLNGEQRDAVGLEVSKRRYNKLWRHCKRMEQKLKKLTREMRKAEFAMVAKHGLAHRVPREEFARDADTACFLAYYTARCNLRSEFTILGQQRPFDEISDMLLGLCRRSETANWWAVAHAYPSQEVLDRLNDTQKGALLGAWFDLLRDVGDLLHEIWDRSHINRETMIVRRGNDSSTWNAAAGAWNKARDAWIELLNAMGAESLLEKFCPGKALRLMAGDVAYWHRAVGGGLDPNTAVWNELPLPWEVLRGEAICTRGMVEAACAKHSLDPHKTGWSAPRPRTMVAAFRPTPELVHGVTVSNPFLADVLKKVGWFSGKPASVKNS